MSDGKKDPPFELTRPKSAEEIQQENIKATMPKLRRECSRDPRLKKCVGAKWLFGQLTDNSFYHNYGGNGFGLVYCSLKDLHRLYGHDEDTLASWRDKLVETGWIWVQDQWPKSCWGISAVCRQPELFPPHSDYVRVMAKGTAGDQPSAAVAPSKNGKTADYGHNHHSYPVTQPPPSVTPTAAHGLNNREPRSHQPPMAATSGGESRSDHPQGSVTPTVPVGERAGKSRVGSTAADGHIKESPRNLGVQEPIGGGTAPPPAASPGEKNNELDGQLLKWAASLEGAYTSRLERLQASLAKQVKQATKKKLREFLQRKLAIVTEKLEGPKAQFDDDEPIATAPKTAARQLTDAELEAEAEQRVLSGALYLLKSGDIKRLAPEHRAALAKAGVSIP